MLSQYKLPFFLAYRYIFMRTADTSISSMMKICIFSMTITSLAFTLLCCIMQGFQTATIKKLQSIHPQIIMTASGNPIAYDAIETIIQTEFKNSIISISPIAQQHIITASEQIQSPLVMVLQALDPQKEADLDGIMQTVLNNPSFDTDSVIIGKKCAELLNKQIGDSIDFLVAHDIHVQNLSLELQRIQAHIGGFFSTGIEEYDMAFILCSFDFLKKHLPETHITQCHIQVHPNQNIDTITKNLSHRFKMHAMSWQELYPALLSTLTLQKWVIFLILITVLLIAGTNLISLLMMYIFHKRKERALLILLNAGKAQIGLTFFLVGFIIGGCAVSIGTFVGTVCAWILKNIIHIQLPDIYYVTHLPIEISVSIIALCWICSIGIVIILSCISAYQAASFAPQKLLKGE